MSLSALGEETKLKLANVIQATTNHIYMAAPVNLLTPKIKARILEQYEKATGVQAKFLDLAAVTDTSQKITYLLPRFFQMTHQAKMGIIFHESLWILVHNLDWLSNHPGFGSGSYKNVITTEEAFDAVLANPKNAGAMFDLIRRIEGGESAADAQLNWDFTAGNLGSLVDANGQITLSALLGDNYMACKLKNDPPTGATSQNTGYDYAHFLLVQRDEPCAYLFRAHLNNLIDEHPSSFLLRNIAHNFDQGHPIITLRLSRIDGDDTADGFLHWHHSIFGGNSYSDKCPQNTAKMSPIRKVGTGGVNFDFLYIWNLNSLASCTLDATSADGNVTCDEASVTVRLMPWNSDDGTAYELGKTNYDEYQCSGLKLTGMADISDNSLYQDNW